MKLLFLSKKGTGKVFPYSLPSVGPGANPGVQAVSPQVTWRDFSPLLLDVPNYRYLIPVLKGSKTLNNTGVWSLIELASLYTVPLCAVNGLSRLTTTSNGQTRPIRKFSNRPITVESNQIGTADSNSNRISKLRRSLVLHYYRQSLFSWVIRRQFRLFSVE